MRAAPLLACAAALLPATACSKDSPGGTETAESASPLPSAPAAPLDATYAAPPFVPAAPQATIELLDPGQPPRRGLRYVWHVSQKEQLAVDLRMSATTDVGGVKQPEIPMPAVHIAIAIEPQSVSPEGDLHYAWHVTGATLQAEPGTSAEIADGMRAQVVPIEHMSGTAVETAQGLSKDVVIDPGSLDAGGQSQMVVQVVETLRDLAAPLPSENVGVGARWQELARLDARNANAAQTDTFTLTSMKGDTGALNDARAQTASPQALATVPGGPPARIESMLISGEAKTRFSLTRLVPQMTFDGTTQMAVSGQASKGPARVTINMRVRIALEGTTGAGR